MPEGNLIRQTICSISQSVDHHCPLHFLDLFDAAWRAFVRASLPGVPVVLVASQSDAQVSDVCGVTVASSHTRVHTCLHVWFIASHCVAPIACVPLCLYSLWKNMPAMSSKSIQS